MNDREEARTARLLEDLESGLVGDLERFRRLAAQNRVRAKRLREKAMIERQGQKRRAVELRAGGRSGVRIAARIGIALRTLRRWTVSDAAFRVAYEGVYNAWKQGDDEAVRLLLNGYHPEREHLRAGGDVEQRRTSRETLSAPRAVGPLR